jgi:hypothetical protein
MSIKTRNMKSNKSITIIAAAILTVILAATLGTRLLALDGHDTPVKPGAATVAEPLVVPVEQLQVPCWSCPEARTWPVDFKTNLDLLAPLGNGSENAAIWFDDFTKTMDDGQPGPRLREYQAAMEQRVMHPTLKKVLPFDQPLLAEAEPWCDMATMRFYPELHELRGYATVIPNLLVPLMLAKTWVARGLAADDYEAAMEDFRRAIRLGRLLRQEDTIVISDLVGLACIRLGTEGIYQRAIAINDTELALLASIVLGEVAPQRLLTAERVTKGGNLAEHFSVGPDDEVRLNLPDYRADSLIEMALNDPSQRFRGEATVGLQMMYQLGSPQQQKRAEEALRKLMVDQNPKVAEAARLAFETSFTRKHLDELMSSVK